VPAFIAMDNIVHFSLRDSGNKPVTVPSGQREQLYHAIYGYLGDTILYLSEQYGYASGYYSVVFCDINTAEEFVKIVQSNQLAFHGLTLQLHIGQNEVNVTVHGDI
jgi:hypothetical protein